MGRYVDWTYRSRTFELAETLDLPVIDVDGRWVRTREAGLHIEGHVFHPDARGTGAGGAGGRRAPRPAAPAGGRRRGRARRQAGLGEDVSFGWSSLTPSTPTWAPSWRSTPRSPPGTASKWRTAASAAAGRRARPWPGPSWTSLARYRPSACSAAGRTPGSSPRPACWAASRSSRRRGRPWPGSPAQRVGVAPGSTPDLDWQRWGRGLRAETVPLDRALQAALTEGQVDAIVGWDPWVEQWLRDSGGAGGGDRPPLPLRPGGGHAVGPRR